MIDGVLRGTKANVILRRTRLGISSREELLDYGDPSLITAQDDIVG